MKDKLQQLIPAAVIVLLLITWEVIVLVFRIPLYVLPAPSKVIHTLILELPVLAGHAWVTVFEAIIGIIIALFLALLLGMIMDSFPLFKKSVYPILVVTQTVPVIVLAPIFIIYLGFGMTPKILTVVLMCFFPIVVSFSDGMAGLDINYVNLLRSYGANRRQVYTFVKLPAAMAFLISGLKVAATYSISGAVVGEWIASQRGLGYYMLRVKNSYMLDKVFACVIAIVGLSLFMNGLVKLLQYRMLPYARK